MTDKSAKRAAPARLRLSQSLSKDWDRLSRFGRYDMPRLKETMLLLIADDAPLGLEW